jgi:hypothetical protein
MRMAQLHKHAQQLYLDLGSLAEHGMTTVGVSIAEVYNTLLQQAKTDFPTDKMIDTLRPVDVQVHPRELQTLTGQLRLVLGDA